MPSHPLVKLLALLASTCAVLILVGELTIKFWFFGWHDSPKKILRPSDDRVLIYELRPGARSTSTYLNPDQTDWKYTVTINPQGFRGAPYVPSDTRPSVIVLGDSYAFGFGVDDDEAFPHVLGGLLGPDVAVLNWGVPGYNLVQEVELFQEKRDVYTPRVIVLAFHPNDFEPPVFRDASQVRRVLLSHLYSIYLHVRFVTGEDVELRLERDRPERVRRAEQAFDALASLARERGFELILFKASCWSGYDDREVTTFFRRSRERGITTVDLDLRFCAQLDDASIPNDGHPTVQGHQLLARKLLPAVQLALERATSDSRGGVRADGARAALR